MSLLTAGLSVAGAAQSAAHVQIQADSPQAGTFSALTFRVPNESDTAGTLRVSIELPENTPLLYVSTKPVPAWTVTIAEAPLPKPVESDGTTITKAVRTVTWAAAKGTQIEPGQYQEFSVLAGPLPEVDRLMLPTSQTYSDGTVVRWDQPTPSSGEEPDYPAPIVVIEAAGPEEDQSVPAEPIGLEPSVDGAARGVAAGALVLSAAGLVLAAVGLRRRRGAA